MSMPSIEEIMSFYLPKKLRKFVIFFSGNKLQKFILIYFLTLINSMQMAYSGEIINDINNVIKKNKNPEINISSLVEKYIKIGQSRGDIENYLLQEGFSIYDYRDDKKINNSNSKTIIASLDLNKPKSSIFSLFSGYYEIRIIVKFDKNKSIEIDGFIFLKMV